MINRRTLLTALAVGPACTALPTRGQPDTRIIFGYTAVTAFASVFVAAEEGYFKKRHLDVELKFIPLNSTIPAALQSDSLQIGGPTPSVFLQAVDGGLDLVVVAGGGLTSKKVTGYGFVARAGSGIRGPQDCLGKKIGVPGLGAFLHVTFRAWLKDRGVDYRKVNFIEAAFPQHGDLLRGGSVDAVITADPFMSRVTDTGVGYVASYYGTFLPDGQPTILYAAKREWVARNPGATRAFRDAVQEAGAFVEEPKNEARVRASIGKYIQVPPEVLAKMQWTPPGTVINDKQLAYWVDLMTDQGMLKGSLDVARLIVK